MLTKTLQIRRVGRFDFSAAVELAQATLIYAENGRGKTTLAAILRSLRTGEPLHILERKTIGATEVPVVSLLANQGTKNLPCTFDGQVWSATLGDCEIFDSAFISQNVYSGSEIDPEHRRSLHKFVLGASNVSLAQKVDGLDDEIRSASQAITKAELDVQKLCLDGYGIQPFSRLKPHPSVDAAILAQQAVVEAARASSTIASAHQFTSIPIPTFPKEDWDAALAATLAEVEAGAEALVRGHVAKYQLQGVESWLSDGLGHMHAASCPFCDSSTEGNSLVSAYKVYFSAAYADLKRSIAAGVLSVENSLGASCLDRVRKVIATNAASAPLWEAHGVTAPPMPNLARLEEACGKLHGAYVAAFRDKTGHVLEAVSVQDAAVNWTIVEEFQAEMASYNEAVTSANDAISILKQTAASTKLDNALQVLKELRNQRVRYQPAAVEAIAKLVEARQAKKVRESEKKAAKEALDNATDALFTSYQTAINKHLKNCGCGYTIVGTKTVYAGGKPRTEYQLVINNMPVELGQPKVGAGPCFKNTLSDGDKSTLAFAFFLARLELDPTLRDKILVLDDPMTSLDAHRRAYTRQQIVSLAGQCRQVIVLTHDAMFARQVWDELPKPKKALQIADSGNKSAIIEWDVVTATQSDYFARYRTILEFVETGKGEPTIVATSLRLLLEGNLRMRFPTEFPAGEWLGDFIKRIKNAAAGDTLFAMKAVLVELTQLNDYAKQFHHDQNPAAANIKPVSAELKAYGHRTLEFAAGKP